MCGSCRASNKVPNKKETQNVCFPCIPQEIDWINYGICSLASDPTSIATDVDCENLSYIADIVPEMVVRIVVRYSLRPDLTLWAVSQGEEVLYVGPEYIPGPFERWETNFVNATAGTYTFDIRFGGGTINYGASFEIWYGALNAPSHHVLLAHGNHTRFVDEVETNGEYIVMDFVIPEANSGPLGTRVSPTSNSSSTSSGSSSSGTLSATYSTTVPTYHCFCEDSSSSGCLQGLCHAADQSQDLCLNLACNWQG
jgi:hypothetical protein